MKQPPTAQGFDGQSGPNEGSMNMRLTPHGTIQIILPIPVNFIELNFYQAQELAKELRKGCKKLLRDGFIVKGREPSDKFPWGRFGFDPATPDKGESQN